MKIPFTKYAIKRFNKQLEQQYSTCAAASESMSHSHARYHIINALLETTKQKRYLEIGVRNPEDNFNRTKPILKFLWIPAWKLASIRQPFR